MVKYNGEYYFPLINSIFSYDNLEAKDVGQFEIKGKKIHQSPPKRYQPAVGLMLQQN